MKNPFVEILQANLMIVSYSGCYSVVRVCVCVFFKLEEQY